MSKRSHAVVAQARNLVQSAVTTNVFQRKHLWIWPLLAAILLAGLGWTLRGILEKSIRDEVASELQMLLETDVTALRIWLKTQEANAATAANDHQVADIASKLIDAAKQPDVGQLELLRMPELDALRKELQPTLVAQGYIGFILVDANGLVVASARNDPIGRPAVFGPTNAALERALGGNPTVAHPTQSQVMLPDASGTMKLGLPTMFALAPVHGKEGTVIGALGLRIVPEQEFVPILTVARSGKTGETYAFNDQGLLVSDSRFDPDLQRFGLIADGERSILNLSLRNPGVDLNSGVRSDLPRSDQPLTKMAAAAVQGKPGIDVDGYYGYQGNEVVGAWTWLSSYGIGVVTEISVSEAFRTLSILQSVFFGMLGLLAIAAAAIFGFTLRLAKLQSEFRQATLEARQLGQYTLAEKLGEGGMGVVYRARHALLHRPTAVKFLDTRKSNELSISRFEREVQLTSQLSHPNTIAIYDFGRTDEGVFYYAMEYLDGLNLEDLIRLHGSQPDGRVISILQQICSSLNEAHSIGLVHRDIKPANIIVNARGGVFDLVKVLDFGLIKAVDSKHDLSVTQNAGILGTPLYMSPEAIQNPELVDARSDIYAVGAVGYFLLSGRTAFEGQSIMEIFQQHLTATPAPFSQRTSQSVSEELEALILQCLAKDPDERPKSARELKKRLGDCTANCPWTELDAEDWWRQRQPAETVQSPPCTGDGRLDATFDSGN